MPWALRKTLHQVKQTIDRYRLLDQGEAAVVAVSGGADSLCLLHVLNRLNQRLGRNWQLYPVHIDPGFATWNSSRVERACSRIGLDCTVKRIDVPAKLRATKTDSCFFCARERRKALFLTAHRLGTTKVCLAHLLEDVNETFLLNLLMTSSGSTFVPRQELFKGAITLVRPLYSVDKPDIKTYLRQAGIRPVRNSCPYERTSMRTTLRAFLERLYNKDRRIRTNIFWGIHNLKPPYLPKPL